MIDTEHMHGYKSLNISVIYQYNNKKWYTNSCNFFISKSIQKHMKYHINYIKIYNSFLLKEENSEVGCLITKNEQ